MFFKRKERKRMMLLFYPFRWTKISLMENTGEKQIQKEEIPATKTEHYISSREK